jgi:hypothetical protein
MIMIQRPGVQMLLISRTTITGFNLNAARSSDRAEVNCLLPIRYNLVNKNPHPMTRPKLLQYYIEAPDTT